MTIKQTIIKFRQWLTELNHKNVFTPTYRVAQIFQDNEGEYVVQIQVINQNLTFKRKPEDILADDACVDQFSPRDVRSLTYLGYLGINSPKYCILAKRLSENNDNLIFALKKRGENNVIVKTAEEIMLEKEIIDNMAAKDANIVGYTFASESIQKETIEKKKLTSSINNKIEN